MLTGIRDGDNTAMKEAFKRRLIAKFTQLFGTEEALGFYFVNELDGKSYSIEELNALSDQEKKRIPCITYMHGDYNGTCCTNHAFYIRRTLPGRVKVYGFHNTDNPTSKIAREKIHPSGHDFAIIDDRFIVDSWLHLLRGQDKWIFDLKDDEDCKLVLDIYGPSPCWIVFKDLSYVSA